MAAELLRPDESALRREEITAAGCATRETIAWLVDGARSAQAAEDVLGQLCERLVAAGLPLWRVAVFVRSLHPQFMGRRFSWREGGEVSVGEPPHEFLESEEYLTSPVVQVYAKGGLVRWRGTTGSAPTVIREFRAEGMTDYLA